MLLCLINNESFDELITDNKMEKVFYKNIKLYTMRQVYHVKYNFYTIQFHYVL